MIKINKYGLKNQLNELLKADKKITIDFNCGNDEAHIVPFVDGVMVEYGDLYFHLEELIYLDLNLPSNGEYMVTGKGYLTIENDDIYLFYDLEGFTYVWDEDGEITEKEDDEPQKEVTEKMKDKYLLLPKEFDDSAKLDEYLKSKETDSKNEQVQSNFSKSDDSAKLDEYLKSKETNSKNEQVQSNFSKSEQELWDDLKGKESKPWWKFW